MAVKDRIRKWLGIQPEPARAANTRANLPVRLPAGGGRITHDQENQIATSGLRILSKLSDEEFWRAAMLDSRTLDRIPAWKLMELLVQLSPEISRGRWDFLRMCNPGWECKVTRPNSKEEDAQAKQILDNFWALLKDYYGSADIPINRLFTCLFLRGEMIAELVLGADGRSMADLATPDPRQFDFQDKVDPVRGLIQQVGQYQQGQFVPMDYSTIKYAPLDPLPGDPRGISLMSSALFSALFLIGLLHDLRRVISQQGWPRIDIAVKLQELIEVLPDDIRDDPTKVKAAVEEAIQDIQKVYANLEPDDTYIHPDTIEVKRPVGTVDAFSLAAVDNTVDVLERMCVRGLKSMPLLMAISDSVNEANANRQWEIYAAGIKSIQHLVEGMLEALLEVGLRASGKQGKVEFRFAELRAAEMLRDAQTEALQILNERSKYSAGWTSQDEASQKITGHDADQEEPRQVAVPATGGNLVGGNPDPGSNRSFETEALTLADRLARANKHNAAALALLVSAAVNEPNSSQKTAAENSWRRLADEEAKGLIDAEVVD